MTDIPSIVEMLDLEQDGPDAYRSRTLFDGPGGMFGGQAVAQSLYAAGLTVGRDVLPHSLHGYFLRRGNTAKPTLFRVERDRDGRTFCARRVVAEQDGEVIFSMLASFAAPASPRRPAPDADAEPAPDLPPPDSLPSWSHPKHGSSFEFRPVGNARLPHQFWVRSTTVLPEDPLVHAAVIAYMSDMSTALIPYETDRVTTGPSLDHAVWFHRPAQVDGWVWQELAPQTVAGGRGWYTVGIYSPDGARIASVAQEQLFAVRPLR